MAVASVQPETGATRLAMPRMSLEMSGFLILCLGAWGGIVPFVGPLFGYSADGAGSWRWDQAHALLFLIPGAVAVFAGLLIMTGAMAVIARPGLLVFAGFLAAVCGAWLVVGPLAWPVLHGSKFFVTASPLREFEYWIGYSLGPGGLLLALGAFVVGRPGSRAGFTRISQTSEVLP